MGTYDRIETDNPLLDEIIYNAKLIMKTCVVKDQDAADLAETVESSRAFDIYQNILRGTIKPYYFNVTEPDLMHVFTNHYDYKQARYMTDRYIDDISSIPEVLSKELLTYLSKNYIKNYQELNEYYRKISGLPPLNNPGIFISDSDLDDTDISIDTSKPIHEMSHENIILLDKLGIIDRLIKENPKAYYLRYITYNIDAKTARLADSHGLLYVDNTVEPKILSRFRVLYEKNRVYFENMMDVPAYKMYSDYFDRFICIIIVAQTVIDMIIEMPQYFIRKDIFDIRTCQYFLEANGVEFYREIPLKYQIRLVQNLNSLIKYKSTDKNIIDICSLFGFENIEIFNYYLMKVHKTDEFGQLKPVNPDNLDDIYELKFIKVPLGDTVDKYYNNPSNIEDYETMTSTDEEWSGPYDANDVRKNILKQEFNIVRSKYMSIDALYSLTDIAFETSYFLNMLLYSNIDPRNATMIFPIIDGNLPINIFDIFMYLFALMYKYLKIETDTILYGADKNTNRLLGSQYLSVRGFDFDANMTTLSNYVNEKGYTLEDLGVDGFITKTDGEYLTIGQMVNIYINNKAIYDHIIKEMMHPKSKEIFDIYKEIRDSLVISELDYSLFIIDTEDNDGNAKRKYASTYTEYLQHKNSTLYFRLNSFNNIQDESEKEEALYNEMEDITTYIINEIDNENITKIFSQFPLDTGDYVKQYMYKIINFFKSHIICIKDLSNMYTIDEEYIYIVDEIIKNYSTFDINEKIPVKDLISQLQVNMGLEDKLDILFDIIGDINSWYSRSYEDREEISEQIGSIISYLVKKDNVDIADIIELIYRRYSRNYNDQNRITDRITSIINNLELNDTSLIDIIEIADITRIYSNE